MKVFIFVVAQLLLATLATSAMLDLEKLLKSMDTEKSSPGHREADSIPKPLLDEFTTYIDRLMASQDTSGLDQSALNREMRYDFNELRKAMYNDPEEREKPLKNGQVPALACSQTPFGCCADGSAAPETGKEGCALRLCEDIYKDQCNDLLTSGELDCDVMGKKCPFSCRRCGDAKAPAAPMSECERKHPGAFCCWDGRQGTGPEGKTCRRCSDHYRRACVVFKQISRGCVSNSWRIRHFMLTHCPKTCGICTA